jgi:aspartyl protease family protein
VLRFVVIAATVIGLALAAPRYAPVLLGAISGEVDRISAEPEPERSEPPPVVEEFEPASEPVPTIQAFEGRRVSIAADPSGHYVVDARINGRIVPALVDTGATTVAITTDTARRLGIVPARSAFTQPVATANGIVDAAPVTLRDVRIGGVVVRDVDALVIPGEGLGTNLLGMSFLGRLQKFESSRGRLILFQ